jgi:peptidoglycan/xylan/chitin deacetylase (PgdA/CDA1 family)
VKTSVQQKFVNWVIRHHHNPLVMGLFTFTLPEYLVKSILRQNSSAKSPWPKKACLTLSFDCDYEADVAAFPTLLPLLDRFRLKASFACVGNWIERFPDAHRKILEYGHEIVNHTYSHPDNEILNPGRKFRTLPADEKFAEIARCHEVCQKILDYEPIGCRIPHFRNLFTPEIYGLLKQAGYRYSSSTWLTNTTSAGMPFRPVPEIWEFPLTTCPKHPFTVFDTWHSFNSPRLAYRLVHRTVDDYIFLFKKLIDWGIETGSYINVYLDPLDIPQIGRFEEICDYIQTRADRLCVSTYAELVQQLDKAWPETNVTAKVFA